MHDMSTEEVPLGLIVNARQKYYPIELSNMELLAHYGTIQTYHQEISENVLHHSSRVRPDPKLIEQQPDMNPLETRKAIVTFAFDLALKTKVIGGIFFHTVRLYDRYCSKRVVLRDQAKFVIGTCLWLAAKTWGGCNHIINTFIVPTGGRFYGPNPRARIPRLSELIHYCGGSLILDGSMFTQMERNILDTLGWDIYEPMVNDYVFNVDESCLIQYELYKKQLESIKSSDSNRNSQDSNATDDDTVEDDDLNDKIQLINIKAFLIDLWTWQYDLLKYELFESACTIFFIINKFTHLEACLLLLAPPLFPANESVIFNIFINAVVDCPPNLLQFYLRKQGVSVFIEKVKAYHTSLHKKLQLAAAMELFKTNAKLYKNPLRSTSNYSQRSNYTSIGNASNSESSVFSIISNQQSPITPLYSNDFRQDSTCGSSVSLHSITKKQNKDDDRFCILANNKENCDPLPSKSKFTGHSSIYPDAEEGLISQSSRSLVSLAVGNMNSL